MIRLAASLIAVLTVASVTAPAYAASKGCKAGQVYDTSSKKCVTKRGS